MKNENEIRAAAEEIADEVVEVLRAVAASPLQLSEDVRGHWVRHLTARLAEHFGVSDSQPERESGVQMIRDERVRQIIREKWSFAHDDNLGEDVLAFAAACYATPEGAREYHRLASEGDGPLLWPFDADLWKPTPNDRIRELVKAGALIAAEIDRRLRVAPSVDTNAHRCGYDPCTVENCRMRREWVQRLSDVPADASPQEPTCANTECPIGCPPEHADDPRIARLTGGEPIRCGTFVESSVLPSKSNKDGETRS